MPGNLSAATVSPSSTVLPQALYTSFTETQFYPLLSAIYHDGTVERSLIEDGVNPPRPERSWRLARRLTTSQLSTLYAFWVSLDGGLSPFYFYDPFDPAPGQRIGSNFDATGASTQGRVKVRFQGNWTQQTDVGRHVVPELTLIEAT